MDFNYFKKRIQDPILADILFGEISIEEALDKVSQLKKEGYNPDEVLAMQCFAIYHNIDRIGDAFDVEILNTLKVMVNDPSKVEVPLIRLLFKRDNIDEELKQSILSSDNLQELLDECRNNN